jgi:hypothetical protein
VFAFTGTEVQPGRDVTITASYRGTLVGWTAPDVSTVVDVEQPPPPPVGPGTPSVTCSANPTTVNDGGNVTLTGRALYNGVGAPGSIVFQYSRDGGAWTSWRTYTVPASGTVTATWASNSPDAAWRWRVFYDSSSPSTVTDGTSAAVTVDVRKKTTKTRTYNTNATRSYQGDGDARSVEQMYQGYYDGTNGDQRSVACFAIPTADWSGWTITKVEAYFYFDHWGNGAGGTAKIGSHTYTSPPASSPRITARQSVSGWGRDVGKWVDITSWGKGLATGSLKGVALGPANSTDTLKFYGYAHGDGQGNEPKIRITGYKYQ